MLGLGISRRTKKSGLSSILLAECDNVNDFDYIYSCDKTLVTNNKLFGNGSLQFIKNSDVAGYFTLDITKNLNLSKHTSLKYSVYSANKSNIASISTTLFTSTPYSYEHAFVYFVGWQLVNGWNTFNIPFTEFTKYGDETLSTVKAVRFTVNLTVDNQTETVNFDRVQVLT
jgi:hypothetical protein